MKRALVTGGSGFIGTHLVNHLIGLGYEVANVDIQPPVDPQHQKYWRAGSILDQERLANIFAAFEPSHVIHLAAYASMEAKSLDEFKANTDGTANLLKTVRQCRSVVRLIVTSTQHVREPGSGYQSSDTDYRPYMLYGQSKVITEQLTQDSELDCTWTIIRPTAVWGPGHKLLADGLWSQMEKGRYFHPAADRVERSYGYVKNVAWQIERLLHANRSDVDRKVFYVADGNRRQLDWVNALSCELTGRTISVVPLWVLRVVSGFGDVIRPCGLKFPLYGSRLKNMITPNPVPVEPTLALLGPAPYTIEEGAKETVEWLRAYYLKSPQ